MLTTTGTLTTAITSKERLPVASILADFLQDGSFSMDPGIARDIASDTVEGIGDMGALTTFLESFTVDAALATDLPDGARTGPGGYASAQATIVVAGNLTGMRLAEAYSGFDNPLSVLAPRIGAPVTGALGMITSVGPETLGQFTGKVRSCSVDPDAGTVTLVALDNRERFRTPVILPVVARDDPEQFYPYLYAQFLIDAIARKQGYYASPPLRTGVVAAATLHGGAAAEVGRRVTGGVTTSAFVISSGAPAFAPHADGLMGLGRSFVEASVALASPVTLNNGATVFAELDRLQVPAGTVFFPFLVLHHPGNTAWEIMISADLVTPGIRVEVLRGGATSGPVSVPLASMTAGVDHYIGVQLTFTATGFVAQAKCDAVTGTATGVVANSTGSVAIDVVSAIASVGGSGLNYIISGLQVTTEAYTAGMFNDAFVPNAVYDESLNEMTATPIVDTSDPWLLVQQIADAEQGLVTFDRDTLHFHNRDFLTGGAAVATITTDGSISFANLKQSASSDEAVDTVNNVISVPATPYVLDPVSTVIWGLSETMSVAAGDTVRIPAAFPGPVYQLASLTWFASQTPDGTGGDITNLSVSTEPVTASTYNIVITNPNPFPAFLVGNLTGGTPGEPNLNVVGRCARPSESGYVSIRTDSASVALYGAQPLDVADNPFRQTAAAADALAVALLAALKDPHPTLSALEIVGDPRLQLGDRVRVADPDGLVLDDDFWLTAIGTRYSATDGLAQSVTLRQA